MKTKYLVPRYESTDSQNFEKDEGGNGITKTALQNSKSFN